MTSIQRIGDYEVLLLLSAGGMATVSVARKVGAGGFARLVVLKRVHPHLLAEREFHDMLRDEARIASSIRHASVVPVIDVVEKDGELMLVLEYIECVALASLIGPGRKPLPASIVSKIFVDALAGLHAAHESADMSGNRLAVIHRDVTPRNILVGTDGTTRITDFGIAKAASRLTQTNSDALRGTLVYMSPEQVKQQELDRRTDIFSAGLVLFEALTRARLMRGGNDADTLLNILFREIPRPSTVVADAPSAFDDVVLKALAHDPNERYQTALEMQQAIEASVTPASAREVAESIAREEADALATQRASLKRAVELQNEATTDETPFTRGSSSVSPPHPRAMPRLWRVAIAMGFGVVAGAAALRWFAVRSDARATVTTEPVVAPAAPESPPAASASATASAREPSTPRVAPIQRTSPRRPPGDDLRRKNPYSNK